MTAKPKYERFPNGVCYRCQQPKSEHTRDRVFEEWDCPDPLKGVDISHVVVPRSFASKLSLYDVFKKCKKCHVKKYVNRETGNCFSCTGIPK